MKRAENCVNAKIEHISFCNDSLVFEFVKSKAHQYGEDHVGPWHVYANPLEPHICPVLSFARYILTYPEVLSSKASLFQGNSQYHRYSVQFSELLHETKDELAIFGIEEGDLGTHSCRKGVARMVGAGCTVSPPIVSICIRAGWVMGGVKDRYLKYEAAGDEYVGRCASGLNQLDKSFAISPPHFDPSHIDDITERQRMSEFIVKWFSDIIPKLDNISPGTLYLATQCFASICYHKDYITKTISSDNPLRAAILFRDIPDDVIQCSVIRYPWGKTEYTPKCTGIPPHVVLMEDFHELKLIF